MSSKSKVTSRQSKNSRIQARQASLVPTTAEAIEAYGQHTLSGVDVRVKRLQSREFELEEQDWIVGSRMGSSWAEEKATVAELRRLEHARGRGRNWYFGVSRSVYSDAERFYFIIRPDFEGDTSAAAGFWETLFDNYFSPETVFVQAFAEAAMNVWNGVKDQFDPENEDI